MADQGWQICFPSAMSSAEWGVWVAAWGTWVAAFTALFLYRKARSNAERDLRTPASDVSLSLDADALRSKSRRRLR